MPWKEFFKAFLIKPVNIFVILRETVLSNQNDEFERWRGLIKKKSKYAYFIFVAVPFSTCFC